MTTASLAGLWGFVWLLHGRAVIALTDVTAVIRCGEGRNVTYRKLSKPPLGPLGEAAVERLTTLVSAWALAGLARAE